MSTDRINLLTITEQGSNKKSRKSNTESMYTEMERVLNTFVDKTKMTAGWFHDDSGSKCKSSWISKRNAILLKVKELLELLRDVDNEEDINWQDASIYHSKDMSLTLASAEYFLDNTNKLDSTNYSADMDITCIESSFFKTPTALRSILKSAQTQRSESARRKVRFEDELEETLAEIIENKENLNWGPMLEESSRLEATKEARNKTPPIKGSRIRHPVSVGKTIETMKILSRNNKPRKSWAPCRKGLTDVKALRDIKTLVEIESERRLNCKQNSNGSNQTNLSDVDSIKTPKALLCSTPSSTGLRLSLIPSDLDIAGLSWTPNHGIELDSSISFD